MSADSIGEKFRVERDRQGLDLNEVAVRTKINRRFLELIEAGDFKGLPGPFFARSFVRQYADALGLDWSDFEGELKNVLAPPEASPAAPVQEPAQQEKVVVPIAAPPARTDRTAPPAASAKHVALSFVVFLLVMLGCSVVYSLWQPLQRGPRSEPPKVTHEQPLTTRTSPESSAPSDVRQASQPPAGSSPSLSLSAIAETWVSVSENGRTVFMGVLKPNETKVLEHIESARLLIGNAGGLQVNWNGKLLGPFGPSGQVRIVQLTADSFQVSLPHQAEKEGSQL